MKFHYLATAAPTNGPDANTTAKVADCGTRGKYYGVRVTSNKELVTCTKCIEAF